MSGSIYDEIKDLVNGVDDDYELIVVLGNTIKILAKSHDTLLEEVSELRYKLNNYIQYVDENLESEGGK